MKKLKLKALELGATELLSREQLKKVFGGDDGSGGGSGAPCAGDKFAECKGKKENTKCCFTYSGTVYSGYCRAYAPDYKLHCSDLN